MTIAEEIKALEKQIARLQEELEQLKECEEGDDE